MKPSVNRNKRDYKSNSNKPGKEGDNKAVVVNDMKHVPIQAQPLEVKVYGNNFDKALRAFRNLVQKERILSTYKEKQAFEKPSDKKRRKKNELRRKQQEITFDSKESKSHTFKPRRSTE
jgi:ribosomal protein S21